MRMRTTRTSSATSALCFLFFALFVKNSYVEAAPNRMAPAKT